jgi:hypothetical protein
VTTSRKKAVIAFVTQPPMLVIPQSASPVPPSAGCPAPGPVGGAEAVGCGMQPSPEHGGLGAAVLEGFWHSGHGDPGTQPTEAGDPAGLGSGTPVGGVVIGVGGWQAGSDEDESGVHAWPLGAGGGAGGAGWAAAAAVAGAAAALIASVPLSTTTRLTTSAGPRLRRGRRCGRGAAGAVVLAEGGNSSFRCLVGAGRGWVGSSVRIGPTGGATGV